MATQTLHQQSNTYSYVHLITQSPPLPKKLSQGYKRQPPTTTHSWQQVSSDGCSWHLAAAQAVQCCHILQFTQGKRAIQKILNVWRHLWVQLYTMWPNQNLH